MNHSPKQGESHGGKLSFTVAPYHRIPYINIGLGDLRKEKMGVANVASIGKSTEGKHPAYREEVEDEAGSSHVSLNLLQLGHGIARLHDEKSWVGEEESGPRVPFGFLGSGRRRKRTEGWEESWELDKNKAREQRLW